VIRAWDRYWFGPVNAIRPYLAVKIILCLLAYDVWTLRVPVGWRYGSDGFNVAHFGWLDGIQPVPWPGLYVGLMLSVGLLALVCALTDPGRWARALLALLFTYGWAMSLLDVFQHHYFLSLVLVLFVAFPRVAAQSPHRTPGTIAATTTDQSADPAPTTPLTVSAWAFVLLGVTVAIVYAFTVVAKLDTEWLTGTVLQRLAAPPLLSVEAWAERMGVPANAFWQAPAVGTLIAEALITLGYLLAPRLDAAGHRWLRIISRVAFLLAVGFHASAEIMLRLSIGFFSYYMVVFACVYFIPASSLLAAATAVARLATWLASLSSTVWRAAAATSISVTLIEVTVLAGIAGVIGFSLDLPGASTVGVLTAAVLVGGALAAVAAGRLLQVRRHLFATGLASLVMWTVITQTSARVDYYTGLSQFLQGRGDHAAAGETADKARRYGSSRLL